MGLVEGKGFIKVSFDSLNSRNQKSGRGGDRKSVDYIVFLNNAIHLSMISQSDTAHKIRQYFIVFEKEWNKPDSVINRAIETPPETVMAKVLEYAVAKMETQKPKVERWGDFSMTANKGTNDWKTDLIILAKNLTVQLSWNDPNRFNYRIEYMGAESECYGFANVLLYVQLSPKVDMIKVQFLIREISYLYSNSNLSSFIVFFMNNQDSYPKYYSKYPTNEGGACALVRKAFKEMSPEEAAASKVLKQLTPQDTLGFNQEIRPGRSEKNLFVFVHDGDKLTLEPKVFEEAEGIERRFITACVEKEQPISIGKLDQLY